MMKHYKDQEGRVYAFESTEQMVKFALVKLTEITDAEKSELLNPPKTLEQATRALKAVREQSLLGVTHAISDGSVYQIRPADLMNFEGAITRGKPKNWILANNTVRLTTVAEMQECFAAGADKIEAIWDENTDALQTLNGES
jgi:hypothetical protein